MAFLSTDDKKCPLKDKMHLFSMRTTWLRSEFCVVHGVQASRADCCIALKPHQTTIMNNKQVWPSTSNKKSIKSNGNYFLSSKQQFLIDACLLNCLGAPLFRQGLIKRFIFWMMFNEGSDVRDMTVYVYVISTYTWKPQAFVAIGLVKWYFAIAMNVKVIEWKGM